MIFLEAWRELKNLTQNKLATVSGVPQSVIWDIENDPKRMPRIDTLSKIANALNITVDDLLREPEPQ